MLARGPADLADRHGTDEHRCVGGSVAEQPQDVAHSVLVIDRVVGVRERMLEARRVEIADPGEGLGAGDEERAVAVELLNPVIATVHDVHVAKRVARMRELDQIDFDNVAASGLTKKELLMMRREKEKLELVLSGIRDMSKLPAAIWVVDTNKEHIAVGEARKLGIPVIAVLDTNCDPDEVDFPIPGNDDAIRAIRLLCSLVAEAAIEGAQERQTRAIEPEPEPMDELLFTDPVPGHRGAKVVSGGETAATSQ